MKNALGSKEQEDIRLQNAVLLLDSKATYHEWV